MVRARSMGMVSPNWVSTETGVRFDEAYFADPAHRHAANRVVSAWLVAFNADLRRRVARYDVDFEPVGISGIGGVFDNRGVDVLTVGLPQVFVLVTATFGGKIVYFDQDNPDVEGYPLAGLERAADLVVPDISQAEPVRTYLRQYDELVELHGRSEVELFAGVDATTGMAQWYLHSPLTTAYRLRGEQIFLDMADDPEMASAVLDAALTTCRSLFDTYEARIGVPIRRLPLATCIASLVSPALYRAWEVPRIRQLAERYGEVRIHSCGISSHILEALADVPGIVEMEVGAGTDIARTRALFPDATINYLIDTPKFVHYTSRTAFEEVCDALRASGDGPFVALWPSETGTPLEAIEGVYAAVSEHNQSARRAAGRS